MKKLKFLPFIFFLLVLGDNTILKAQGINFFEGSWAALLEEARKQDKPIFVDCYTKWCGPCKQMSKEIFPLKEVGESYNRTFICYKLDMETEDGAEVKKKYSVYAYPTFLYLDAQALMIHKTVGYKTAKEFIKDAKEAFQPEKPLLQAIKRFNNGERDEALLHLLIDETRFLDPKVYAEAADYYMSTQKPEDLVKPRNYHLMGSYVKDVNSPLFQYVLNNRKVFEKKFKKKWLANYMHNMILRSIKKAGDDKDEELFYKSRKLLADFKPISGKNIDCIAEAELYYYARMKNETKFDSAANANLQILKDEKNNYYWILQSIANSISEGTSNKALLSDAEKLAEKSVNIKKRHDNLYTLSVLQFKNDKFAEAEKSATEALAIAKEENRKTENIEKLLEEIKQKKSI